MSWDPITNKIVAPKNFPIPISFLQKVIRTIIIENHPRTFAWFNCVWADEFGHSLEEFDDSLIKVGKVEEFNTRAIYIDGSLAEELKGNTTEQSTPLLIEIITGFEQLAEPYASINPVKIVGQNYSQGVAMIFSCMPRERLLRGIPGKQPKPVAGLGGTISYTLTDGKVVADTNPLLAFKGSKTELINNDQGELTARSQLLFDLNIPLIKTLYVNPNP